MMIDPAGRRRDRSALKQAAEVHHFPRFVAAGYVVQAVAPGFVGGMLDRAGEPSI
jgi:hypothetical protein